ncbi:unnamed protein product [Rotaria socialis]|uniref:Uncharacterized protein n=1 Tax=Rotaria socialis TaxID=392032 RepID=A0A818PKJ6_9BILA|nr:unnamed protein product [Rotaria socialis]CAF4459341.1 unnamed protein product [Rotaria socialis]
MMYSLGRPHSDVESILSETSDVTSRATTLPDTWSDVKSDATLEYQSSINGLDSLDIPPLSEDDHSSIPSSTAASVSTVVDQKMDKDRTNNNNESNETNIQNQQQTWSNPYWNSNGNSQASVTQLPTNKIKVNANIEDSSSPIHIQQLIPGSILINDEGEIDDLSWKQNAHLKSSTSDNSFNPGGKYVADDSGGPGGYLAPTHMQRRIVTSSPGLSAHPESQFGYKRSSSSSDASIQSRPTLSRQQTFPDSTNNDIQPWINPYWPKTNQTNSEAIQNDHSSAKENSLINPNFSAKTYEASTSFTESNKSNISMTPVKGNQQWNNPYWKNKNASDLGANVSSMDTLSSVEHDSASIPSFYERVYPPSTPLPAQMSTINNEPETNVPNEKTNQNINDDEDTSYTIDNKGIAHYLPELSSPMIPNKAVDFTSLSTSSQYPSIPPGARSSLSPIATTNNIPLTQIDSYLSLSNPNNIKSPQLTSSNSEQFSLLNAFSSSASVATAVLTEEDLNNIHHALHLLETNPNAVSIMVSPAQVSLQNTNNPNKPFSSLDSLFNLNKEHQSQQQQSPQAPPSFLGNIQPSAPSYPYNSSSQQVQPPSLSFPGNLQPSTPSYPQNSNTQQIQSAQSVSSSLPENIQSNTPLYSYNTTSQQSPLFSTFSYPSNSKDTLTDSTAKGVILI